MEEFFKSIKKNLVTLPGFNFLNYNEEEKKDEIINEGILDESKYDKLLNNVNENKILNDSRKNKNTRKKKISKSKTRMKKKI